MGEKVSVLCYGEDDKTIVAVVKDFKDSEKVRKVIEKELRDEFTICDTYYDEEELEEFNQALESLSVGVSATFGSYELFYEEVPIV